MVPGWLAGAVPDWGLLKSAVRRQVFVITGKVVGSTKLVRRFLKHCRRQTRVASNKSSASRKDLVYILRMIDWME